MAAGYCASTQGVLVAQSRRRRPMFVLAFNSLSLIASVVVVYVSAVSWLLTLPFLAAWSIALGSCVTERRGQHLFES
jgi:hypothetical protein